LPGVGFLGQHDSWQVARRYRSLDLICASLITVVDDVRIQIPRMHAEVFSYTT